MGIRKIAMGVKPVTSACLLVFALLGPLLSVPAESRQGGVISLNDDVTLPASQEDVQIAQRAKQILDRPEKWDRADTRACRVKACNLGCPTMATTFSLYCALKRATEEVTGRFDHRGRAMQETRSIVEAIAANRKDFQHRLEGYNNSSVTTFNDIQQVLQLLEERFRKRLAAQSSSKR